MSGAGCYRRGSHPASCPTVRSARAEDHPSHAAGIDPILVLLRRLLPVLLVALLTVLAIAPGSSGHPERATTFPDPAGGAVPTYKSRGPSEVVCLPSSRGLIGKIFAGDKRLKRGRTKMLKRCKYYSIQDAVNAAKSGDRILILPGTYTEPASRAVPVDDPKCQDDTEVTEGSHFAPPPVGPASNDPPVRPSFKYQHDCPNSKNLIAVIGDSNGDGKCDAKCNLQIEGLGKDPKDVQIVGDRRKADVIRGDRADGLFLKNLSVEQAEFNGIDVVETNGFRFDRIVAKNNQNYGVLSFTAVHGLYENIDAFGNGDSGVYPGRPVRQAVLDRDPQRRLPRQHARLLGHGR